jgi:ribulose 1,5-bisphosphate synthetase/thiazole synthase
MCLDIAICSRTAEQRDARPPVRVQRIMATKISAAGTMITSDTWDVAILGSGIAGLAAALAAYEFGLRPVVLEKAGTLGGSTVSSYGHCMYRPLRLLLQGIEIATLRGCRRTHDQFKGNGCLTPDCFERH